jgi:YVTN family beta-propeller protein
MRVAQRSAIVLAAAISGLAPTAAVAAAPAPSVRGMAAATSNCIKVKATIPVGSGPDGIAVDPVTHTIYVTNQSGNSVSVINGGTDAVTATVGVGSSPAGIAVDPATNTVYVANEGSDSVSVINGGTDTVTATIGVGSNATAVAVNPVTDRIYAGAPGTTTGAPGTTYVINGRTNKVAATFQGHVAGPFALSVNSRTDTAYLANGDLKVLVINGRTNTVTAKIRALGEPGETAVNQQTNTIYAGNSSDGDLSVINGQTNTVTAQIPVAVNDPGFGLIGIAVNQRSNDIYVNNGGQVFAVNGRTNTVSGSIQISVNGIAVNPSTGIIYTAADDAGPESDVVSALTSTCP